eukprot:PhF_6_TR22309/c0_g1_i1/m.31572
MSADEAQFKLEIERLTEEVRRLQDMHQKTKHELGKLTVFSQECAQHIEDYKSKNEFLTHENACLRQQLKDATHALEEQTRVHRIPSTGTSSDSIQNSNRTVVGGASRPRKMSPSPFDPVGSRPGSRYPSPRPRSPHGIPTGGASTSIITHRHKAPGDTNNPSSRPHTPTTNHSGRVSQGSPPFVPPCVRSGGWVICIPWD